MTREEKELALYCLKASSDYHSEVCEECIKYPNCDHTIQDDVTETIIKALEQESCEDWCDVPSDEMTLEQARQAVKDLRKKLAEYLMKETCEDCVSRQAAIDAVNIDNLHPGIVDALKSILAEVPPFTPQQKMGKWVYTGDYITEGMLKCSECGFEHDVSERFSYCPNCGAKMQEVKE